MKKNILTYSLFLFAGMISSCQSDLDVPQDYGYLQLTSVDVNKEITTKAESDETPIAVEVLKAGAPVVSADDWNELKEVLLPVGNYTIKAYSSGLESISQGFDAAAYYEGGEDVTIEAGKLKPVEVVCKLAQAQVSVNATEAFKTAFSSYTSTVTGNEDLSIEFVQTETRKAYVKAGQPLTLNVDFGNESVYTATITENTQAAYHYQVILDINEGGTDLDISVDQTVHQYSVVIKVPRKQVNKDLVTTNIQNDVSKVWGQFAYLYGTCNLESAEPVQFSYRQVGTSDWTTVNAVKDGETNNYKAKVSPLNFDTDYEYYILCGDKVGETMTFHTEASQVIPNLNCNDWSVKQVGFISKRDCWYPNTDASNSFWATGNEGVTSLKSCNTIPVDDENGGKYVQMSTIDISMVGYAAGNLFLGEYSTNMSDPGSSVKFGRLYNGARPVKLTGMYKYAPGPTMREGATVPADRILTSDECEIYIKLWSGETLIGQGSFVDNKNVAEFTKFECPIQYLDETKRPDKITIVATSSRYGGEFEGMSVVGQLAVGSVLCVDDFELLFY